MSALARTWLPTGALQDETLSNALLVRARAWGETWLSQSRPIAVTLRAASNAQLSVDTPCWRAVDGLLLTLDPNAVLSFAGWLIGLETGTMKFTPGDKACLSSLALKAGAALLGEFAGIFQTGEDVKQAPSSASLPDHLRFGVSLGQASPIFELFADAALAAIARKALLGRPVAPSLAPGARQVACGRQGLRAGAMIGRTRLGLGELWTLEPGDVLVLDNHFGATAPLTINGRPCAALRGELLQQEETIVLRIKTESQTCS